jgi:hypothetical protein
MNLLPSPKLKNCQTPRRAVALVITLLMLSVITFLAIAFLAMTSRNKAAVTATQDLAQAKAMSEAALARAQADIIAQMMSTTDILNYGYLTTHNYINPGGFVSGLPGGTNFNNVNYDHLVGGPTNFSEASDPGDWAQNIANLWWDPRPPVFVTTNASGATDFRFWVDLNRNGFFEPTGLVQNNDINSNAIPGSLTYYNGEPEWIGVLKYPETNHSWTNLFLGRYAYLVLPIGQTLDWNYIHNSSAKPTAQILPSTTFGEFSRDQGIGSWELNLAGMLANTNLNINLYGTNGYFYNPGASFNTGLCFSDAAQFLRFRYAGNNFSTYPLNFNNSIGPATMRTYLGNLIDLYGAVPSTGPVFDYNQYATTGTSPAAPTAPWPGSYNTNLFYDIQELFDTNKTGPNFAPNLSYRMSLNDTYDRYTFQRLLGNIGMGSAPEYGVYVYPNQFIVSATDPPAAAVPPPSLLRTKVNINFDNTSQIAGGPYTPMSTNLVAWSPIAFFTNAADLLLRSQVFVYTNYVTNGNGFNPSNMACLTFGVTNIPVYNATNPGIVYNEQVHRMLQLAANIYAAAYPSNYLNKGLTVPQPPVFRPQFAFTYRGGSNLTVTITNFVQVPGGTAATVGSGTYQILSAPFLDLTNTPTQANYNFWGVPWIVGTVKGLPEFNQFSSQTQVFFQRHLLFVRHPGSIGPPATASFAPPFTNQFYEFSISNMTGMDVLNQYSNNFDGVAGHVDAVASNLITITLTNNYRWGTNIYVTNVQTITNFTQYSPWPGGYGVSSSMFKTLLQTNLQALPYGYFSESQQAFVPYNTAATFIATNPGFLPADTNQTSYPTHRWTVTVTNRLYYALFDGDNGNLYDFVNLGPFGTQIELTNNDNQWIIAPATDAGTTLVSQGLINQIGNASTSSGGSAFQLSLQGMDPAKFPSYSTKILNFGPPYTSGAINTPVGAAAFTTFPGSWMSADPLVHYTIGDLTYPSIPNQPKTISPGPAPPMTNSVGLPTKRYSVSIANTQIVFGDTGLAPGLGGANSWQFPTNVFPSIGWLGRVHRGTPWQTVYLKSDDATQYAPWRLTWVNSAYTYPTNDWTILDLFTTAPNDNAARGLLSVNQANEPAWAAVFAGVVAQTSATTGVAIDPTNSVTLLVNGPNGINAARAAQLGGVARNPNGLFHHIGDVLQASALTVNSPFLNGTPISSLPDEAIERIPQQTLSLMKVGLPQFVIYSWGQALKPKSLCQAAPFTGLCTNYDITAEFLTRTVCHVVGDPAATSPKIVVDSYNIESGN